MSESKDENESRSPRVGFRCRKVEMGSRIGDVASEREMRDSETSIAEDVDDERSKDKVEVEAEVEEKSGSLSASEA